MKSGNLLEDDEVKWDWRRRRKWRRSVKWEEEEWESTEEGRGCREWGGDTVFVKAKSYLF